MFHCIADGSTKKILAIFVKAFIIKFFSCRFRFIQYKNKKQLPVKTKVQILQKNTKTKS